jgi:hypothetical protein
LRGFCAAKTAFVLTVSVPPRGVTQYLPLA